MTENVDLNEIAKFSSLADSWWDPTGESRALHELNPARTNFVAHRTRLQGARVLDVGCGGGILSESLAAAGAIVTGIDATPDLIEVARAHASQQGLVGIRYECTRLESFEPAAKFDAIVCMELLEHVPDPAQLIEECAKRLDRAGDFFVSTINRTAAAYIQAILGAEYVFGLLPRGTHDYSRFIKPSELARWARASALQLREVAGMRYNPLTHRARLDNRIEVNYLAHFSFP